MELRFIVICSLWIYTALGIVNAQSVLNYFNAQALNNQVVLNWEIQTGNTCDGIEIQHSTDGLLFSKIGEIAGVCGSKTESIAYQFTHQQPQINSLNYYRLVLGGFGNSELETVEVLDYRNGYILRPNPINDRVQLTIEKDLGNFNMQILDLKGHIILNSKGQGSEIQLNTYNWSPGVYLFNIQSTEAKRISGRFIICK